ncbi:ABC transporter substrate-binding protein [Yinghuangia soli]|uniref:ABC transporter substrate-binding protein n=1 Tax=Yinghuangia soli TaxID=2908204 RepID=A0AA41U3Q8_9ACTN|nr:ABC transporter substrate-binding protein [Yinghuangia soli]MCF2532080.1 ABC transporter substrate-binding protein [Yinghuangia soli]
MPHVPAVSPTRRRILAAGAALGLGALATACGSDDKKDTAGSTGNTGAPEAGSGNGPWSFKDDRGQTVTAKKTPKRIVAFIGSAAVLKDYGLDCVGVFGPTKTADGKADVQAGDVAVDKVTIIGNEYGQFAIEKYAALQPELLITNVYDDDELWYVPADSKDKIVPLAPTAAIRVAKGAKMADILARYTELAASLGADVKAQKTVDAKARFEAAAEKLRQAVKANGGLKVLAASGSADLFYTSNPAQSADLQFFKELGVDFIVPDKLDPQGYFESLSWENAGKYRPDVIILDNRSSALQPKDLAAKPTWNELAAVKAGQVFPWASEPRFSYAGFAPVLEQLADALGKAKKAA